MKEESHREVGYVAFKALCSSDNSPTAKAYLLPNTPEVSLQCFQNEHKSLTIANQLLPALKSFGCNPQTNKLLSQLTPKRTCRNWEPVYHGGSEPQVPSAHTLGGGEFLLPNFRHYGMSRLKSRLSRQLMIFSISISKYLQRSLRRNRVPRTGI